MYTPSTDRMAAAALEARVAALEPAARSVQSNVPDAALTERLARVKAAALRVGLPGTALFRVPPGYYDTPLASRAALLACPPAHLCKTIVLEHVGVPEGGLAAVGDLGAPLSRQRYLAVILQYVARLRMDALERAVLPPGTPGSLRMAPLEVADALTGFPHNGMTPIGSATGVPIILAKSAAALPFLWLGGGEVDVKLRVFTRPLLARLREQGAGAVAVIDCTVLREGEEEED